MRKLPPLRALHAFEAAARHHSFAAAATELGVTPTAISHQIRYALDRLPKCSVLKLYNSGSFFDSGAIPKSDYAGIAQLCSSFRRVVVECHPRLIDQTAIAFAQVIGTQLEIAIGLETAHPVALEKINKRISLFDYVDAIEFCKAASIDIRTFLLVHPPFVPATARIAHPSRTGGFA